MVIYLINIVGVIIVVLKACNGPIDRDKVCMCGKRIGVNKKRTSNIFNNIFTTGSVVYHQRFLKERSEFSLSAAAFGCMLV